MIARIWHGMTQESKAEEFVDFMNNTGIPALKASLGNLGVMVFRRAENQNVHFLLTSLWDSFESITQFAGPDIEVARYYPNEEQYLVELEPTVTHHEVIVGQDLFGQDRQKDKNVCMIEELDYYRRD